MWGRALLPENFNQPAPAGAKSPILNRYSLVAPQLTLIGSLSALSDEPKMIIVRCT